MNPPPRPAPQTVVPRPAGRRYRPLPALTLALLAAGVLVTAPAAAQRECLAAGPEPYICGVEIEVSRSGERARRLDGGRPLRLASGESVELRVEGFDQFDRRFPADRAGFVLEPSRRCERGAVEVEERGRGLFRLEAKRGRGSCELLLWVPGNLNLEWTVPVELRPLGSGGFSREQAELVAISLYRAILGREADPPGLAGAIAEIQRGRLSTQVEAMAKSDEFRRQRAGLPAAQLLEDLYRGLLGRAPDSAGERRYLREVERGDVASVALDILRSEEFERRLTGERR